MSPFESCTCAAHPSASCRVAQVPPIIGESVKVDAATFLASIDLLLA